MAGKANRLVRRPLTVNRANKTSKSAPGVELIGQGIARYGGLLDSKFELKPHGKKRKSQNI